MLQRTHTTLIACTVALIAALLFAPNAEASPTSLRVNFGYSVSGWDTDTGADYTGSAGYGWVDTQAAQCFRRNGATTKEDTICRAESRYLSGSWSYAAATWKADLAPGTYDVIVGWGDTATNHTNKIVANGTAIVNGVKNQNQNRQSSGTVTVGSNGILELTFGSSVSFKTALNYIEAVPTGGGGGGTTTTTTTPSTTTTAPPGNNLPPASPPPPSAQSFNTWIVGGNVATVYAGDEATTAQIKDLIRRADRSTCTSTPNSTACDGMISPGDRLVATDYYLAWMDLTRKDGTGGGGGGLLAGIWELEPHATRGLWFVHELGLIAPNNLFPCQHTTPTCPEGQGDALEMLASLPNPADPGVEQPELSYRASSAVPVVIVDGNYGGGAVRFHFHGRMTQGTNSSSYTDDIGAQTPAVLNYNLVYEFHAGRDREPWWSHHTFPAIDVTASVDVCGQGPGCGGSTRDLNSVIVSLGLGRWGEGEITSIGPAAFDGVGAKAFQPLTTNLEGGLYEPSTCSLSGNSISYAHTQEHNFSDVQFTHAQKKLGDGAVSAVSFRNESTHWLNFLSDMSVGGQMLSHGGISTENYHQLVHDGGHVNVYDHKWADEDQCGQLGSLAPGEWLQSEMTILLDRGTYYAPALP